MKEANNLSWNEVADTEVVANYFSSIPSSWIHNENFPPELIYITGELCLLTNFNVSSLSLTRNRYKFNGGLSGHRIDIEIQFSLNGYGVSIELKLIDTTNITLFQNVIEILESVCQKKKSQLRIYQPSIDQQRQFLRWGYSQDPVDPQYWIKTISSAKLSKVTPKTSRNNDEKPANIANIAVTKKLEIPPFLLYQQKTSKSKKVANK